MGTHECRLFGKIKIASAAVNWTQRKAAEVDETGALKQAMKCRLVLTGEESTLTHRC